MTFTGNISYDEMIHLYGTAQIAVRSVAVRRLLAPVDPGHGVRAAAWCARAPAPSRRSPVRTARPRCSCQPADPAALACAIKRLLEDESLRTRLSTAARERVLERFTWAAMAKRTAEQYRVVIDEYASRGAIGLVLTLDYDRLGMKPGDRVLDIGCGYGRHSYEAVRRGGKVVVARPGRHRTETGSRHVRARWPETSQLPETAHGVGSQRDGAAPSLPRRRPSTA